MITEPDLCFEGVYCCLTCCCWSVFPQYGDLGFVSVSHQLFYSIHSQHHRQYCSSRSDDTCALTCHSIIDNPFDYYFKISISKNHLIELNRLD